MIYFFLIHFVSILNQGPHWGSKRWRILHFFLHISQKWKNSSLFSSQKWKNSSLFSSQKWINSSLFSSHFTKMEKFFTLFFTKMEKFFTFFFTKMDKFFTFFFNKKLCESTLSTFMFFSPYNGKSAILFLKKKIPKFQIHIQLLHKDKGTFWKMGTTPSALQAEECSILINLKFNIIPFRSPDHHWWSGETTGLAGQTVSHRLCQTESPKGSEFRSQFRSLLGNGS